MSDCCWQGKAGHKQLLLAGQGRARQAPRTAANKAGHHILTEGKTAAAIARL